MQTKIVGAVTWNRFVHRMNSQPRSRMPNPIPRLIQRSGSGGFSGSWLASCSAASSTAAAMILPATPMG